MNIEWLGIAEAAVEDGRNAMILVGVNQNVIPTQTLPIIAKRSVVVLVAEDQPNELEAEERLILSVRIQSPSRETILAGEHILPLPQRRWDLLPVGMAVTLDVQLNYEAYGRYEVTCTVSDRQGTFTLTRSKDIYIVSPPDTQTPLSDAPSSRVAGQQ